MNSYSTGEQITLLWPISGSYNIDVNIHQTEPGEVGSRMSEQAIWRILSAAVKGIIGKQRTLPTIDF